MRADLDRAGRGALAGLAAVDPLADRRDVLRRRAAAAADDADAVALDVLAERLGERLGLGGEDRLAVGPWWGMPALGMQCSGSGEFSPR